MLILLFDTETNGLPVSFQAESDVTSNWPYVIQIAWQLRWYAPGCEPLLLEKRQLYVKPRPGMVWSTEAEAVHGISLAKATAEGLEPAAAITVFFSAVSRAQAVVAHNMRFDRSVVEAELYRLRDYDRHWPTVQYCTLQSTVDLCKLSGGPRRGYKYPSMKELYSFLYDDPGAFKWHSAEGDVECLVRCFDRLRLIGHVGFCPSGTVVAAHQAPLQPHLPTSVPPAASAQPAPVAPPEQALINPPSPFRKRALSPPSGGGGGAEALWTSTTPVLDVVVMAVA